MGRVGVVGKGEGAGQTGTFDGRSDDDSAAEVQSNGLTGPWMDLNNPSEAEAESKTELNGCGIKVARACPAHSLCPTARPRGDYVTFPRSSGVACLAIDKGNIHFSSDWGLEQELRRQCHCSRNAYDSAVV
jgi:hypothetical protein